MERQLKERLVGAAVLVAAAVILVPEMFSGSGPAATSAVKDAQSSVASSAQLKTYHIELQAAQQSSMSALDDDPAVATVMPETVQPPASAPRDEEPSAEQSSTVASSAAVAETVVSARGAQVVPAPTPAKPTAAPPVVNRSVTQSTTSQSTASQSGANTGEAWVVQVGSFSTEARAKEIAAQIKSKGQSAFVTSVKVSGKTYYRVRVGPMAERAAADAALAKLKGTYSGASVVPAG